MPDPTTIETADVLAIDAAVLATTGSGDYGLTTEGFFPKPFARLLAEKLALARALFGDTLDLSSGSTIRKLLEISALEDARTWAGISTMYESCFVSSAQGDALSRLGLELGLPRPQLEARGSVKLKLVSTLPAGVTQISIPRGARMSSAGGHHVATDERVVLSTSVKERIVSVAAFYPGPSHNINPSFTEPDGSTPQKLDRWNRLDPLLKELDDAERAASENLVIIEHTAALTGGELQWPDTRYRELLLRAPRSIWTVDAIQTAVSLTPGVRQVRIHDALGGLDINQSIFGNFNFIERLFGTERDIGNPYYFTVLVAPTPAAVWEGPDGLRASIENVLEDLRPIGILPQVKEAEQIGIGVQCKLVVEGLPLPTGSKDTVNSSAAAVSLKKRVLDRLQRYIDGLKFGEPVRASEVIWSIMNEPGLADALDLQLLRFPPGFDAISFNTPVVNNVQKMAVGENVTLQGGQIAVFVDDPSRLEII
ncbi:MAG: hypothetical protein JSR64_21845 [Nitrospira sp.]|nr:hypothetical protein [Nitrospira sp.]MBX3337191.1 hypothetical protein [Nitrospira sp.]MCW5780201.1 hypothetical protein [Nitrospira sp.]